MSRNGRYGRYQAPEPPSALRSVHLHRGEHLGPVDHEPPVGVLDQEDLLSQGIRCSEFISGATDVKELGSCTANATTARMSAIMSPTAFMQLTGAMGMSDVVNAERWAIKFYHQCTSDTADPGSEWPPNDVGSSGPHIVNELRRLNLINTAKIAHGPDNIASLMQSGGLLVGSPWFASWEEPDANGFVDGDGSADALQQAIQSGVVGGHETHMSAIESIEYDGSGVNPYRTIVRHRNSWSKAWGDNGSCRFHLSTWVMLGAYCDFRLVA